MKTIGVFKVRGDRLMLSDPCYERGTWCQGVVEDVKPGKYVAKVAIETETHGWGPRVAELEAVHQDFTGAPVYSRLPFEVGVDSGQAGIFDDLIYPEGNRDQGGEFNKDGFYDICCNITLEGGSSCCGAGVLLDGGVVSSSGYGDGGYAAYAAKDGNGKVVAVKIVFIGEDEDEQDEDETCDECGSFLYECVCDDPDPEENDGGE